MKVYEKMGINPNTKKGVAKLISMNCGDIPDKYGKYFIKTGQCLKKCNPLGITCRNCKAKRLFAEVSTKTVKRWEIYKGDMVKAYKEWSTAIPCPVDCPDDANDCANCFAEWLMEEIEVAE